MSKRKSKIERFQDVKKMSETVAGRCQVPTISKEVFRGKTTYKEDGTPIFRQISHDFGVSNTYPQEKWIEAGGIRIVENGSGKGNDKILWIAPYPVTDEFVKKLEKLCSKHRKALNVKYDRKKREKRNLNSKEVVVGETTAPVVNDLYAIPTEEEMKSSKVQQKTIDGIYNAMRFASQNAKNIYLPRERLFLWYDNEMKGINLLEKVMGTATRFTPEFIVRCGYFNQRGIKGQREFTYAKDVPFTKEDAKIILIIYNRLKTTTKKKVEEPVVPTADEIIEMHEAIADRTLEPIQSTFNNEQYSELIARLDRIEKNQIETVGSLNQFMDKILDVVSGALNVAQITENTKEFIIDNNGSNDANKK